MITDEDKWREIWELNWKEGIPPDPGQWTDENMSADYYNATVMVFVKRWMELMDEALSAGETLGQCARRTSRLADHSMGQWGPTGFQYACAVAILISVWDHGEELRCWHNLDTDPVQGAQANENGTMLNPAVLIIGES